eukprot:4764455-Pyramimonas_sp.AAC.1
MSNRSPIDFRLMFDWFPPGTDRWSIVFAGVCSAEPVCETDTTARLTCLVASRWRPHTSPPGVDPPTAHSREISTRHS